VDGEAEGVHAVLVERLAIRVPQRLAHCAQSGREIGELIRGGKASGLKSLSKLSARDALPEEECIGNRT
jgi:hypothetical protein